MKRVLVLGDICTDVYWQGHVSGLSAEATVPVVKVSSVYTLPGMGANVASLLQSLGDVQGVLHLPDNAHWAVKNRLISEDGSQVARWDVEDFCTGYTTNDLPTDLSEVAAVIVCDYNKGAITNELIDRVLDWAEAGTPVFVDTKNDPFSWLAANVTLFPNRAEYTQWQSKYDWMPAVVFKQSELGASFMRYGKVLAHVPSSALTVRNVCGAGDAVIAAYTWACIQHRSEPLQFAIDASSAFVSLPCNTRTLQYINAIPVNV